MTRNTSEVAVCCSSASPRSFRASASSLVRSSSTLWRFGERPRRRAAAGASRRLALVVFWRRVFIWLPRPPVRRFSAPMIDQPGCTAAYLNSRGPVRRRRGEFYNLSAAAMSALRSKPREHVCPLSPAGSTGRRNTALNLSAGVSNPRVLRGRSLSWRATLRVCSGCHFVVHRAKMQRLRVYDTCRASLMSTRV